MKKRKMQVVVRPRTQRQWLASEITEFDSLLKQLEYPNAVVQKQARQAMGRFTLAHGSAKCNAMAAHLDAGGELVSGPHVEVLS